MLPDETRKKVADIVHGTILEGNADTISTIRNHLCASYPTSRTVKKDFENKLLIKEEQAKFLSQYSVTNNLMISPPSDDHFLARGGEALVYLANDGRNVIKLNDAVYYATWLEFFNSVLLHNLFFPNTSYKLLGFATKENTLMAILEQPFIISDELVELNEVKEFLAYNDFEHTRRQDYKNAKLGLILEDMHDENVLRKSDNLFFIDSVFYTISPVD